MKRKAVFVIMAAALLMFAGCAPRNAHPYQQISMQEAADIMATEEEYIIIDVRTEEEFASGHIPGAICIPNETISEDAEKILTDKDTMLLVYCRSGNRSKQASEKLAMLGYTDIREFGGIIDWTGDIEK